MSRGNRHGDIFFDDVDRHDFLKMLTEACTKSDFQVHAFCLVRNRFHILLETPNANLVDGMAPQHLYSALSRKPKKPA